MRSFLVMLNSALRSISFPTDAADLVAAEAGDGADGEHHHRAVDTLKEGHPFDEPDRDDRHDRHCMPFPEVTHHYRYRLCLVGHEIFSTIIARWTRSLFATASPVTLIVIAAVSVSVEANVEI